MLYEEFTQRNFGIIKNQECLRNATIAIAGCGGGGGETAITLARMGIGRLKLADPDPFEVSNLNRQSGLIKTVGVNKAEAVGRMIEEISPFCKVEIFNQGISETNVGEFVKDADIVLEEIEYRKPYYTVLVHREARRQNIPVMTAVPVVWSAFYFYFDPNGLSFEEYIGLEKDSPVDVFKEYQYPSYTYCPEPPFHIGRNILKDIIEERIEIPCVSPGVKLSAGILASFAYFYLSGEREIKAIPHYYWTGDMFTLEARENRMESSID